MEVSKFYFFHLNIFIVDELKSCWKMFDSHKREPQRGKRKRQHTCFFLDLLHSCEGVL